jgi:hypothetical protein
MKYTVETVSRAMIYMPSLMTISSDLLVVILRVLPQQFERL